MRFGSDTACPHLDGARKTPASAKSKLFRGWNAMRTRKRDREGCAIAPPALKELLNASVFSWMFIEETKKLAPKFHIKDAKKRENNWLNVRG